MNVPREPRCGLQRNGIIIKDVAIYVNDEGEDGDQVSQEPQQQDKTPRCSSLPEKEPPCCQPSIRSITFPNIWGVNTEQLN